MRSTGVAVTFILILVPLCLLLPAQDGGPPGNEATRILSLENAWDQAEVKHDAHAMNMLLADVFDYTDDDGSYMDRAQWLAHLGNAVDHYEHLDSRKMVVHLHGNIAVVTGMYQEKLREKGKPVTHYGRFTDTWIYQKGEWKCASSQSTLIRD
jgi:ketosteroid isomerase-like protein